MMILSTPPLSHRLYLSADQFADLKRELATVTAEEWDSIPDVGDSSLKVLLLLLLLLLLLPLLLLQFKQNKKKETFMPVPDFLIESRYVLCDALYVL